MLLGCDGVPVSSLAPTSKWMSAGTGRGCKDMGEPGLGRDFDRNWPCRPSPSIEASVSRFATLQARPFGSQWLGILPRRPTERHSNLGSALRSPRSKSQQHLTLPNKWSQILARWEESAWGPGPSVAVQECCLTLPTQGVRRALSRCPRSPEPRPCLGKRCCRTGVGIAVAEVSRHATGMIARRLSL